MAVDFLEWLDSIEERWWARRAENINNHKIIKALDFAGKNDRFTVDELCVAAGIESYAELVDSTQIFTAEGQDGKVQIRYPAMQFYIEVTQLREARKASTLALWVASGAFAFGAIVGLVNILINILQG